MAAPVAPNESVVLFIRVRGGLGCGVVGWFGGGAERWSVFLPERRIPWWGCSLLFLASIFFVTRTLYRSCYDMNILAKVTNEAIFARGEKIYTKTN